MRVPLHWLRELVDIDDIPVEELAERLSHTGSAVDFVERFADGVSGVVVGHVLEVADVPESDKLVITKMDVGDGQPLTILAGAKNFSAGDKVPVARVGATVTTIDGPLAERPMLKGKYTSQGMLCSAKELGVADEHEGILVLEADAPVGADVAEMLGLNADVFEFEIYPNRPDQMSVLGIAREVALLYGRELRVPDYTVVEDGPDAADATSVAIEDLTGCPRYLARVIDGVSFGTSPALVRARLSACGIRPLGNLIDVTNYVLLLTGQPLHAFDLDKLGEHRIVVRRAAPGESMTTLDGQERKLDPEDLVIADASVAQALAGVMGGGDSEVGPDTTRVLLESAHFDARSIGRTSRRHFLRSEASARFERGSDPEMVSDAAALAAELMRRWAGGVVAKGAVDVGSAPQRRTVTLRPERVKVLLGIDVSSEEIVRLLRGLGCEVTDGSPISAVIPSWRPDLEREVDLIEEVARLHGYETMPAVLAPGVRGGRSDVQIVRERIRDALLGAGLSEATLSSFIGTEDLEAIAYEGPLVGVANPMTEDQRYMRPTLFAGLLRAVQHNVAHGVSNVRLFEFGKVFRGWEDGAELPIETEDVGFVLAGSLDAHWSGDGRDPDAYDGLGLVELMLGEIGINDYELVHDDLPARYHPGRSATLMRDGEMIGRFGELRPSTARAFDLEGPVVIGGLALDAVYGRTPTNLSVSSLPTQPPVLRDISMWLPDGVLVRDVIDVMRRESGDLLTDVEVRDEYRSEGRRSVAFGLTFRAADRTLRAEDADAARAAIAAAVSGELGAEVR